jgi:hypothetical protein
MLMMGGDDSLNGLHHRHTGPAGHEWTSFSQNK